MIEYIQNCVVSTGYFENNLKFSYFHLQSYEQAFGQVPGTESHSGSTFCALASLFLSDNMDRIANNQKEGLIRWLVNKVDFGFSGRTNKPVDTCYSFWTGGSLHLLEAYNFVAPFERQRNKLMFAQHRNGGLSKFEYYPPDPLHTSLGLAGLSMMKIDALEEVYVPLVITKKAFDHLKGLQEGWSQNR